MFKTSPYVETNIYNHIDFWQVWYTHRPPSDATCRRRAYSSADTCTQDSQPNTETIKLNIPSAGSSSGAAVAGVGDEGDIADINLADMNPEDIRVGSQSLFQNKLGWVVEGMVNVKKDFNLAKRHERLTKIQDASLPSSELVGARK